MSTDTLRSTAALPAVTSRHWLTAGLAFIGLAFGYTSMAFLTLGVFMRPLGQEFGWNRGEVASALSIGAIILIFTTPIAGRLIDRIGVRKVLLPSMAAMGFALMGMYFISGNLLGFYAMFAVGAVVSTAANNVSYIRLLSACALTGSLQVERAFSYSEHVEAHARCLCLGATRLPQASSAR